jgi:uncharacterized membrane protein YhhN
MAAFIFLMVLLEPFAGRWAIKAVPAVALALWVYGAGQGPLTLRVALGLLFSAGGDVALEVDREGLFIVGLGLFLVAHLLYIWAFAHQLAAVANRQLSLLASVPFGLGVGLVLVMWPVLGGMALPVAVYAGAISAMTCLALLRTRTDWKLAAGAVLFMASDSVLAINKFLAQGQLEWGSLFVMTTYYTAQWFIAHGAVAQAHPPTPTPR